MFIDYFQKDKYISLKYADLFTANSRLATATKLNCKYKIDQTFTVQTNFQLIYKRNF